MRLEPFVNVDSVASWQNLQYTVGTGYIQRRTSWRYRCFRNPAESPDDMGRICRCFAKGFWGFILYIQIYIYIDYRCVYVIWAIHISIYLYTNLWMKNPSRVFIPRIKAASRLELIHRIHQLILFAKPDSGKKNIQVIQAVNLGNPLFGGSPTTPLKGSLNRPKKGHKGLRKDDPNHSSTSNQKATSNTKTSRKTCVGPQPNKPYGSWLTFWKW